MLKYNVPHESNGFYMGTQYHKFVYPEINDAATEKNKWKEMRGMFQFKPKTKRMEQVGLLGFPFYTSQNKKIICVRVMLMLLQLPHGLIH